MLLYPPKEQTIEEFVEQSKAEITVVFAGFVQNYLQQTENFWKNSKFTPEQLAEAWGEDTTQLFINSGAVKQMLVTLAPETLEDPVFDIPYTIGFNEDGTVTLTAV